MIACESDFYPTDESVSRPLHSGNTTMRSFKPMEGFNSYMILTPPKRSRISFGPTETLAYIETTQELTRHEREDKWYQPDELESMKHAARNLCQMQAKGQRISADESIRGMDVYYPSRQRYHKKHVEHVLHAYHFQCGGNDDHVAQLSEKWSFKNKQLAEKKGFEDFYEAYFPQMKQPTHQQHQHQINDPKRKGSGTPVPEPQQRRS